MATSIGALLRYAFIEEFSWLVFRNFLHAHSHVAMLGWVYLALFTFFIKSFLIPAQQKSSIYQFLFWGTQITVAGMLISFPLTGYATASIIFSSLHILLSYVFTWRFLKDLKKNQHTSSTAYRFIRTAFFLMILSTLAIWALAPIMISGQKGSGLYHMAIQFYLHFQFNGWFVFGVLALFFKMLEVHHFQLPKNLNQRFFGLLISSCFLTYALAITWAKPDDYIFWINSLGVSLQFLAIFYFTKIIKQIKKRLAGLFNKWTLLLFKVSLFSFLLKVLIQTAVLIPYIATVAYTVRNFAMGFIHLMLLGLVTCFLIAYGNHKEVLSLKPRTSIIGIVIFLFGFFLSEALLFFQGILLWQAMGFIRYYYEVIFMFSFLMPLGIGIFWLSQILGNDKTPSFKKALMKFSK